MAAWNSVSGRRGLFQPVMDRIGRYEIVRELGHGAMGVVYLAVDPTIGRQVAIKTIKLGDVDDARLKRGIAIVAEANKLPRAPAPSEIFDRSFLPPRAERPSAL